MQAITTQQDYQLIIQKIEYFLQKATKNGGFHTLDADEADKLAQLSLLAEQYEDKIPLMPIAAPQTLKQMLELKMYQMQLKQKDLAKILAISESKLSDILNGRRRINIDLAKKLHQLLQIDAEFILEVA